MVHIYKIYVVEKWDCHGENDILIGYRIFGHKKNAEENIHHCERKQENIQFKLTYRIVQKPLLYEDSVDAE